MSEKKITLLVGLCIGFFFVSLLYFRVVRYPYLDHGDSFEDAVVLVPGANFVKFGFVNCRFLPVRDPQVQQLPIPKDKFYTHSPPFSEIFNGILRKVFHSDSLSFFRIIALDIACLTLLLWWFILKRQFGAIFALFGLICLAANPLFIGFADCISRYLHMEFYRVLGIFCFIIFCEGEKRPKKLLYVLWIIIFIEAFVSYEYLVSLYAFMGLHCILFKKRLPLWQWSVLMSASFCAIAVHFLQNAWALGGIQYAYRDLAATFRACAKLS